MATPVGHALVGFSCALVFKRRIPHGLLLRWYIFAIVAANAPDFDFIPGLLTGDINRFHQGPSHSILAALLFGLACLMVSKWLKTPAATTALLGFLAYTSHLIMDMFAYDGRAPIGIPLFWPVDNAYLQFPITLFNGVKHGVPGDSMAVVLSSIFSVYNLTAILVEVLTVLPVLLAAMYLASKKTDSTQTNIPDKRARS